MWLIQTYTETSAVERKVTETQLFQSLGVLRVKQFGNCFSLSLKIEKGRGSKRIELGLRIVSKDKFS